MLFNFDCPPGMPFLAHCFPPSPTLGIVGIPEMSDLTQILDHVQQGDPKAAAELLPLVYEELRKLARNDQRCPGISTPSGNAVARSE